MAKWCPWYSFFIQKENSNTRKIDDEYSYAAGRSFENCILSQNSQPIGNKKELIQELLLKNKSCLCLCIQERWKSKNQIKNFNFASYNLKSKFCREEYERGGTAVHVKSDIKFKNRHDLEKLSVCGVVEIYSLNQLCEL
ncbi:hypothetical protein HHI36_012634, partial [Cryptolaemus montrouzieri]